jgi:hypothetical protein
MAVDVEWALPLYLKAARKETAGYQAIGKVVQDVTYHRDYLPDWTLKDWGYGSNKVAQLERNYVNQEEFNRVRTVLRKRDDGKYTSVAVSLRGQPKDSRSQGWCMLSLVISRTKEWTRVEVQYRTTELILKFAADIWFLVVVCDQLQIKPQLYTFRFANCALSGAYFPYLVDKTDLVKFLDQIHDADQDFFFRTTRFLLKASYRKNQYMPFSPERLSHRFLWERGTARQINAIRDYLEPLHRTTGRPLPKDFHDSSYIPKGRRVKNENLSDR